MPVDHLDVWLECLNPKYRPVPGLKGWQVLDYLEGRMWMLRQPAEFPPAPSLRLVSYIHINAIGWRQVRFMYKRRLRIEPNQPAIIRMEDPIEMVQDKDIRQRGPHD